MTLSALESGRRIAPFAISFACTLPWIVVRGTSLSACALIVLFALIAAFFYMILDLRRSMWQREKDRYVNAQIRHSLITLIPEDVQVTVEERTELVNSRILGELDGVFWNAIEQDPTLRSHKEHFYANGLMYTTAIDGFYLSIVYALCYFIIWPVLDDFWLLISGSILLLFGGLCRWTAIPSRRQRHLDLSLEQLRLLKEEKGDFIATKFRRTILEWRANGRLSGDAQWLRSPKHTIFRREVAAGFSLIICAIVLAMVGRGWFGPGPGATLPTEIKSGYIRDGSHNRFAAVVFVHGIFGTKEDTWVGVRGKPTFPELLADDEALKDKVDVFVFEYFTPKFGAAPSIVSLTEQFRGELNDGRVFESHQRVAFLAHSMGGLVVRQYLLHQPARIDKVPMVFFYATPTNGSEMATIGQLVSVNPQFRGMKPIEGNDLLQSIQSGWLSSSKAKSIASYCGVEELPTFGFMIVTRSSATSLCSEPLDPFSADHIGIVKPQDREDPRYTRFRSALQKEVLATERVPDAKAPGLRGAEQETPTRSEIPTATPPAHERSSRPEILSLREGTSGTTADGNVILSVIGVSFEGDPLRHKVTFAVGRPGGKTVTYSKQDVGVSLRSTNMEVRLSAASTFEATFMITKIDTPQFQREGPAVRRLQ